MRQVLISISLLGLFVLASGCGGPKTAEVSGQVTHKTKGVGGVTVSFMCSDNSILTSSTDASGNYTIAKVPQGVVKVAVTTPPIVPPNPQAMGKGGTGDVKATKMEKLEEIKFPDIYKNPETSKLTYTVTGEPKQKYDIDLK